MITVTVYFPYLYPHVQEHTYQGIESFYSRWLKNLLSETGVLIKTRRSYGKALG